jgi:hypothetical protein
MSPKIVIEEPRESSESSAPERNASPRSSPITRLRNEVGDAIRVQQMRKDKEKHKLVKEIDRKERSKDKAPTKPSSERIIIGGEESATQATQPGRLPREIAEQFEGKSREVSVRESC